MVSNSNPEIRNEAVVALEQLAEPRSLKVLTKQRSVEKDDAVQASLIRAIASVGRGNRTAETLVLKVAGKDKKDFLRIHALIGLVYVENREKVNALLAKNLTCPARKQAALIITHTSYILDYVYADKAHIMLDGA